ncbi:MAG: 3-hydroxyacyl-ACP dehydratase FabZ family protein [bacterium]
MKKKRRDELNLGPDVLRALLPHRRPFLMVDRITAYDRDADPPYLRAERHISGNEPVFEGHFPDLSIWPGVYTQEGLGQSCNLLVVLLALQQRLQEQGGDPGDVLRALRNLELGHRLQPGFQPDVARELARQLPPPATFVGFTAQVELKFLAPVFAGQVLTYHVTRDHLLHDMVRCGVEASVEGRPVAQGLITGKFGIELPVLRVS